MSNPAVTNIGRAKLYKKFGRTSFWMDDNIGESIHIHIEDIRIDLTNSEFDRLFSDICSAVNEMIDIKGFDCRKINPSFLLDELWDNLRYLRAIKIDNALLREMICPVNGTYQNCRIQMQCRCLKIISIIKTVRFLTEATVRIS